MADATSNMLSRSRGQTPEAADPTYADLPWPGEMDPEKLAPLALICARFGPEACTVRAKHIGQDGAGIDKSEWLYRTGREDGSLSDQRPTINRVKKSLDGYTAASSRTPIVATLKCASSSEDGFWVLKRRTPYRITAALITDPLTKQPIVDPDTGMPYQDVTLQFNQQIPEGLVDHVTSESRIKIDAAAVVKWEQATFDAISRDIDFPDFARKMTDYKQKTGWLPVFYVWDQTSQRPVFLFFPLQQWYLDPLHGEIERMNRVRLDAIMDAAEAMRLFPDAMDAINESASRSVKYAPGSFGYSSIYTSNTASATPMVTMVFFYLRNVAAPMNLAEAQRHGIVTVETPNATDPESLEQEGPGSVGGMDQAAEPDEPESPPDPAAPANPAQPVKPKIMFGEHDLSDSFNPDGSPNSETPHPHHPKNIVTVQWIQIDGKVVPGTYKVCPTWDIPVMLDKNNEIMWRPYADPETVYLKSPQIIINNMYTAFSDHTGWFRGPTGIISKELESNVEGGFKDGFKTPGSVFTVDIGALGQGAKISDHYLQIQPPPMTAAIPELLNIVTRDYERIADAGVRNGTPPPGVTAASAIAALQGASEATSDLKSTFTEKALRRGIKLWIYDQARLMTIDEILKFNRTIPREIVETWVMPMRKDILWDAEASIATGAGQIKQQKDAAVMAQFQTQLLDEESAQDALGLDSAEIKRRKKEMREEIASEQAEAAAAAAPPSAPAGPQKPPFNLSVSTKLEAMSPQDQSAVLQMNGLPGLPVSPPPAPAMPQRPQGQPSPQGV